MVKENIGLQYLKTIIIKDSSDKINLMVKEFLEISLEKKK